MRPAPLTRRLAVSAALLCLLAGCHSSYDDGYQKGQKEGYQRGYDAGFQSGRNLGTLATTFKYEAAGAPLGILIGFILGGAVVAILTRRYVAAEWRKWRRRRAISGLLASCDVDLDADIYNRALRLGLKKRKLEEALGAGGGKLIDSLRVTMQSQLGRLERDIVKLAVLFQQLRNIQKELPQGAGQVQSRIASLESSRAGSPDAGRGRDVDDAIAVEQYKLVGLKKNAENAQRCDTKLSTLDGFLDSLIITLGNVQAIEQSDTFEHFERDASEELASVLSSIEKLFSRTISDLLSDAAAPTP